MKKTTPRSFSLKQTGRPALCFKGDLVGVATNREHLTARWAVLEIYRKTDASYIVHLKELSSRQGDKQFFACFDYATAEEVLDSLRGPDGRPGKMGLEALADTARHDTQLRNVFFRAVRANLI